MSCLFNWVILMFHVNFSRGVKIYTSSTSGLCVGSHLWVEKFQLANELWYRLIGILKSKYSRIFKTYERCIYRCGSENRAVRVQRIVRVTCKECPFWKFHMKLLNCSQFITPGMPLCATDFPISQSSKLRKSSTTVPSPNMSIHQQEPIEMHQTCATL